MEKDTKIELTEEKVREIAREEFIKFEKERTSAILWLSKGIFPPIKP